MDKLLIVFALVTIFCATSSAQMPPPGYERARKAQEEMKKISPLDRDSISTIDTIVVFDPENYESETRIIRTRISVRDYCTQVLGIGNADILLDRQPHTIIDPRTYDDLIIRLNASGKIDTIKN